MAIKRTSLQQDKLRTIEQLLKSAWRSSVRRCRWTPVIWTLVLVLMFWITSVLLERLFFFTWPVKSVLWASMICLGLLVFIRIRRNSRSVSFELFYRRLADEMKWPELKNLLDLMHSNSDAVFHKAAIKQNLESVQIDRLRQILVGRNTDSGYKFYRYGVQLLGAICMLFIVSLVVTPAPHERMFHFWKSFLPPNPFNYSVSPGDRTVNQNDSVHVFLTVKGDHQPDNISIQLKTDRESEFRIRPMSRINDSTYASQTLIPVIGITYRVRMDRYLTRFYRLGVELRPRFRSLYAVVHPPSYTGLDTSIVRYPFASINAYPGSEIDFTGILNKPVKKLMMVHRSKKDTIRVKTGSGQYIRSVRMHLVQERRDSCSFVMVDSAGLTNDNAFAFVLNPITDNRPLVHIITPSTDLSMLRPDTLDIAYELNDDYGFHRVTLHYRIKKAFLDTPVLGAIGLHIPLKPKATQTYRWDLTKLGLDPLDRLQYWVGAKDNDRFAGYQTGISEKRLIRMESMAETISGTDKEENGITGMLDSLKNVQENIKNEMNNVTGQIASGRENNLTTRQQLDRVEQTQKSQEATAARLSNQVDSLRHNLQKDRLVSKQTLKEYDELKRLIDQIKDPALRKAIEELQKSLSQNQDDLTRALQNYKFNEQLYRQKLQRTIDLFKLLKLTMSLDKLEKATKELAKREHGLTTNNNPAASLREQNQIRNELNQLVARTDTLPDQAPDRLKSTMNNLSNALSNQSDTTNTLLRNNIKKLHNGNPQLADVHNEQNRISRRMGQMAHTLEQARQQMTRKQKRLNLMALKNIMQDLLLLSDVQEGIAKDAGQLKPGTDIFVDRARDEHNILVGFRNISDSLRQLASQIPVLSESITQQKEEISNRLNQALDALSNREPRISSMAATGVLSGINELASMVSSLIEQLSNSPSGMGGGGMMSYDQMLKEMRQLSAGQKGLNGRIQDMLNDLQGNRLSENQMERFKQLAAEQDMIRRQIQQLQRSGALEPGDRALSDLQRVQNQMNDAVNELRGASTDRLMMNRQQNILSRMLTAEHAMQQRGLSKKRQSETAGNVKAKPPAMTMEKLRESLNKQMETGRELPFTPEYRQLIDRYFNLLKQQLSRDGSEK